MGFRTGSYAKIWGVEPKSETNTKVQLSISRKNKQTNDFETEFSGFVMFIGSAAAKNAAALKRGDRIKLGDVDVTTSGSKEEGKYYTNFKCFSFEKEDGAQAKANTYASSSQNVDSGEVDDSRLPF